MNSAKLTNGLPEKFLERLGRIIPGGHLASVTQTFSSQRKISARINTLKAERAQILGELGERDIPYLPVPWSPEALRFPEEKQKDLNEWPAIQDGRVYIQSLSSMLAAQVLDCHPGERVLDLCAAPGSKTTQMAASMKNKGEIVCVENIKNRYYKLKSVVKLLGADIVRFYLTDGRKFRDTGPGFDRVLVDAPCSSEGRFRSSQEKTFAYWSPRKIKEMVRKQRGLILNASRMLKPGGVLVYSTCTFAPEENEGVVDWLLRKTAGRLEVEPVSLEEIGRYPALGEWEGRAYHPQVKYCFRVLPNEEMEGFFIAKIIRKS
ncbi:MAG: RsmB/NOP family class I SAM-dependent RNA methyltransferase [Candidatus Omnitrophota bacterium]